MIRISSSPMDKFLLFQLNIYLRMLSINTRPPMNKVLIFTKFCNQYLIKKIKMFLSFLVNKFNRFPFLEVKTRAKVTMYMYASLWFFIRTKHFMIVRGKYSFYFSLLHENPCMHTNSTYTNIVENRK